MTLNGQQINLGVDDPTAAAAAEAALKALLERLGPVCAIPHTPTRTVAEAVADYLVDLDRRRLAPDWRRCMRRILVQFRDAFANVQISRLRADQVEGWVEAQPWSLSHQNNAVGVIQGLLRAEGISFKLRKPPKESRGADTCLTDEQFETVIRDLTSVLPGRKRGDLAELLRLLRETGARPGEVVGVTVDAIDWGNAQLRLDRHKTRRHTGKPRIIHFNSAAVAILETQRTKYGDGLLFRTRNGNPYSVKYLTDVLRPCSKRVGFRVIAYGLGRHGFATRALVNGVPDTLVAGLLGHTGTTMLHRHYSHISSQGRALKAAAELASSITKLTPGVS